MQKLKQMLSAPDKRLLLAERAAAALCLTAAFVRPGGSFLLPLLPAGLALGLGLIWLCSLNVNGFGFLLAVLLEYYAGQMEMPVMLAMTLFSCILFFCGLSRNGDRKA